MNLALINIFFYRLAEHGTDRSAQILILLIVTELLILINDKKFSYQKINLVFILIALTISLKSFYLIYIILLLPVLFLRRDNFEFLNCIFNKIFYLCFIFVCLMLLTYFVNTGCLIYPLSISSEIFIADLIPSGTIAEKFNCPGPKIFENLVTTIGNL